MYPIPVVQVLWTILAFITLWTIGNSDTQIAVSYRDTCILRDFNVSCWGSGGSGILGTGDQNNSLEPPATPIDLGDNFMVKSIDCGGWHCCGVSTTKTLKCWGNNWPNGQLGLGHINSRGNDPGEMGNNLSIIDLGTDFDVDHVSCGDVHTCVLSTGNGIKCFGANGFGQLGYGHNETIGNRTGAMGDNLTVVDLGTDFMPIHVACGQAHTCALSDKYQIKCWGWNVKGTLGQEDTVVRGDDPGEMGDNLWAIDLGTGFNVSSIRSGCKHVCAFSIDNTTKCWGANGVGQLGRGDIKNIGKTTGEMGDDLPILDLGNEFSPLLFGGGCGHNIALSADGTIKAWGYNIFGQLGYGDTDNRGDDDNQMGSNLALIDVGDGYTVTGISVSCCSQHSCALLENGTDFWGLKCWGHNDYGQLGLGVASVNDTENRGDEIGEMGSNLSFISFPSPTMSPTNDPTPAPTGSPTHAPTGVPSVNPTTADPTQFPTGNPTIEPTVDPTNEPTFEPTDKPTNDPTSYPTITHTTTQVVPSLNVTVEITPATNESGVSVDTDFTVVNVTNAGFEFGGYSDIGLTDWCAN